MEWSHLQEKSEHCSYSLQEYLYSPISNPWGFRLITLHPGYVDDPLECQILHHSIHKPPNFIAISYFWGDASSMVIIDCGSNTGEKTEVSITVNCASALRALRSTTEAQFIWIDGLCINQQDYQERDRQVRLMPKIYSSARQVAVYLGDEADDSDMAMDFIAAPNKPVMTLAAAQAIHALLGRPWFTRTWVIQEVAVAKTIIVRCATKAAPWDHLMRMTQLVRSRVPPVISPIRRLKPRGWISIRTSEQFLRALCEARSCHCTDARDRIFAFASMWPSTMNQNEIEELRTSGFPVNSEKPQPILHYAGKYESRISVASHYPTTSSEARTRDRSARGGNARQTLSRNPRLNQAATYSNPTETIYMEAARLFLAECGVDFLSVAQGHHQDSTEMPSWVPDWRVAPRWTVLAYLPLSEFRAGGSGGLLGQTWQLTSGRGPLQQDLVIRGVKLGKIRRLARLWDVSEEDTSCTKLLRWSLESLAALGGNGGISRLENSFLKTIFMETENEFSILRRKLHCHFRTPDCLEGKCQILLDEEIISRVQMCCTGRRFFVTDTGVHGLVGAAAEIGDTIFVPLGAKVPLAFRSRKDKKSAFSLISDCFASGYMKGEAVQEKSKFGGASIMVW